MSADSLSLDVPGLGTAPSAGAYPQLFTHGLGTRTPVVDVFERTAVSPEAWRKCADTEFDSRSEDANAITVTFPATPPTPGHVGARRIFASRRNTAAAVSAPSGGGLDATGFRNFLSQATAFVEGFLPTTIRIGDSVTDLAASRWSAAKAAQNELSGMLPTVDVVFRVRRELLTGLPLTPEVTRITEAGTAYRLERIRAANGDPALVLECKAV